MENNLLTVSIGISAYNEEGNIARLIEEVRTQRTPHFMIKEIIVVSDGSTDETADIVRGVPDVRVRLIERDVRVGQAQCQNEILGIFESDALIFLEADTRLETVDYLALLTYPIWSCTADLVFGLSVAQSGGGFIERSLTLADRVKKRICMENVESDFFLCHSGKALSRSFAKRMRFMPDAPEDALTFLKAKELGFRTMFEGDAVTYYRSAGTVFDYFHKYARFAASHKQLQKYVSADVVARHKYFPHRKYFIALVRASWESPALVGAYIAMHIGARFHAFLWGSATPLWKVSLSTKNLGRAYE